MRPTVDSVNFYQQIAQKYEALLHAQLPLFEQIAHLPARHLIAPEATAPRVVIFSPHPDDECITGVLPLRLMQELGYKVINVVVTLGSKPARQVMRWQELQLACQYLGFELIKAGNTGLNNVILQTQADNTQVWQSYVAIIAEHIRILKPEIIMMPHQADAHLTHQGTHALVMDALRLSQPTCWLVQTEFWHPMLNPNLMVACSKEDLAVLMTGLACHVGEVMRNPYHLRLPAWMADNVRRGEEIMAGTGQAAPSYSFATLYRVDKWQSDSFIPSSGSQVIAVDKMHSPIFYN